MEASVSVGKYFLVMALAILVVSGTTIAGTGNYNITFDAQGNITGAGGSGYNSQWYYYPASDRYIMWFHTSGYDIQLIGDLVYYVKIQAADTSRQITYDVKIGWTTPIWNTNPPITNSVFQTRVNPASSPPLPDYANTASKENTYFTTSTFRTSNGPVIIGGGYIDTSDARIVDDYNPEWIYISVKGKNLICQRHITFDATLPELGPDEVVIGACCNRETGTVYLTDDRKCYSNFTYLGDGTGFSDCSAQNFIWDYGDAPASYGVLQADNGAKHTVDFDVKLGANIGSEEDGQPSLGASLDQYDDGIQFITSLTIGQNAQVQITASTLGSINAWLDLNQDGDWTDFGEQVLLNEPVVSGTNNVSFFIPNTATAGQSYMRFRYNTTGGLTFLGEAADGEVEDYAVTIIAGGSPSPNPNPNPSPTVTPVSPSSSFSRLWHQPVTQVGNNSVFGWNIPTNYDVLPMIADDWKSNGAQPIQGFRWWGAFESWIFSSMPTQLPTAFHFAIWSNNETTNKPLTLVWETAGTDWAWAYTGQIQDARAQPGGEAVFEFTYLLSQDQWFYPDAYANTTYWISITPLYEAGASSTPWGWVTREIGNTNPAVQIQTVTPPNSTIVGPWPPTLGSQFLGGAIVMYPSGIGWDMAFDLITQGGSGGGGAIADSDLANAVGDQNNDGIINADDLYLLINLMLTP